MLLYLLLVLAALLQVESRPVGDKFTKNLLKCVREHDIQIESIANVKFGSATVREDNDSFNELAGCLWEKAGIWTKEHQIDEGELLSHIRDVAVNILGGNPGDYVEVAKEILESCRNSKGETFQETSTKMQNCINVQVHERENKVL